MIKGLSAESEEEFLRFRAQLEAWLEIDSWSSPLSRTRPTRLPVDGPWWWRGDEEASDSFITSMGIQFD